MASIYTSFISLIIRPSILKSIFPPATYALDESKYNPSSVYHLIYSKKYRSKAITIDLDPTYDNDPTYRNIAMNRQFPIHLKPITEANVDNQMFEVFVNKIYMSVGLQSVANPNLKIMSDGDKLYASKTSHINRLASRIMFKGVEGSTFFHIISEDRCLTTTETPKSINLTFQECILNNNKNKEGDSKSSRQLFGIATNDVVLCKMKGLYCPDDEMQYLMKQKNKERFIEELLLH